MMSISKVDPETERLAHQQHALTMLEVAIAEARASGLLERIANTCLRYQSVDDVCHVIKHFAEGNL
jgi:hypothetical protein